MKSKTELVVKKTILGTAISLLPCLVAAATSLKYLDTQNKDPKKYFIVQNIATETVRVYERCTAEPNCDHKMILEDNIVVGRTEEDEKDPVRFLTWPGYYKIQDWEKFHEDGLGHYPSWYDPAYPAVPPPRASFSDWLDSDIMPDGKYSEKGVMRGAFGWYLAHVGPNANSQWFHGTAGWGKDKDKFIKVTRGFWINLFKDVRSSGCTRMQNGLVAFMRHMAPPGTDVLRVYAWEGLKDASRLRYQKQKTMAFWHFALTNEDVRKINPNTADYNSVVNRGVSKSQWIEDGFYDYLRYPTPRAYKKGSVGAYSGELGNIYTIPHEQFHGMFLVDTGRFIHYKHPQSLRVGGYKDIVIPDYVQSSSVLYALPRDSQADQGL